MRGRANDDLMSAPDFFPATDCFEMVALLTGQLRIEKQFRHAENAVHRSANFMAHLGQKLAWPLASSMRKGWNPA